MKRMTGGKQSEKGTEVGLKKENRVPCNKQRKQSGMNPLFIAATRLHIIAAAQKRRKAAGTTPVDTSVYETGKSLEQARKRLKVVQSPPRPSCASAGVTKIQRKTCTPSKSGDIITSVVERNSTVGISFLSLEKWKADEDCGINWHCCRKGSTATECCSRGD